MVRYTVHRQSVVGLNVALYNKFSPPRAWRLLLNEDPALELSPGSMWWCCSLSFVDSDGVNKSMCTEVFCSGVYFLDSVHYPPPPNLRTGPKLRTTPKIRIPWKFPRSVPNITTTLVAHKHFGPKLGNNTKEVMEAWRFAVGKL